MPAIKCNRRCFDYLQVAETKAKPCMGRCWWVKRCAAKLIHRGSGPKWILHKHTGRPVYCCSYTKGSAANGKLRAHNAMKWSPDNNAVAMGNNKFEITIKYEIISAAILLDKTYNDISHRHYSIYWRACHGNTTNTYFENDQSMPGPRYTQTRLLSSEWFGWRMAAPETNPFEKSRSNECKQTIILTCPPRWKYHKFNAPTNDRAHIDKWKTEIQNVNQISITIISPRRSRLFQPILNARCEPQTTHINKRWCLICSWTVEPSRCRRRIEWMAIVVIIVASGRTHEITKELCVQRAVW